MDLKIVNLMKDGSAKDITQLVSSLNWGGDRRTATRSMDLKMMNSNDYYTPKYIPPLGSEIYIYDGETEVIRGFVFKNAKDLNGGLSIKVYDGAIYLTNNQTTRVVKNIRAEALINDLCAEFGIEIGSMPSLPLAFEKRIYREQSIYDIIISVLTEVTKKTGIKYMARMIEGKLHIVSCNERQFSWRIDSDYNLMGGSYSESIENMKNKIIIMGEKDQYLAEVSNSELISLYGQLQKIEKVDKANKADVTTIATELLEELGKVLQEASVECVGIPGLKAGDEIILNETFLGLQGYFYVDKDAHSYTNGFHKMNLTLKYTDEVLEKEGASQ